jgi:hypothetical protein
LHGQFHKQLEEGIDNQNSNLWLTRGDLKAETEGLLMAAQNQSLPTKSIKSKYYKQPMNMMCRVCKVKVETPEHILTGCSPLASTLYTDRHNSVAAIVHKSLCQRHGFQTGEKWYEHKPEKVLENESAKILWDFKIYTDKKIEVC